MPTFTSLRDAVRTIPDYPKPGIMFRDITTLLGNPRAFRQAVDELVQPWAGRRIDKVAGMEARGFILGGAVAHQLSAGFVPIRKKGKLPHSVVSIAYSLEYGVDEMEIHTDAVTKGEPRHPRRRSHRHGRHRDRRGETSATDRRGSGGSLFRHRPAGTRRREKDRGARRARAHADDLRRPLNDGAIGPISRAAPAALSEPADQDPSRHCPDAQISRAA